MATWSASNLTICGVGGRARLFADGQNAQGKAIWVVSGSNITIDSIEFNNATVPDQNGAGIRAEHGGNLLIRNGVFFENDNGIWAAAVPPPSPSKRRSLLARLWRRVFTQHLHRYRHPSHGHWQLLHEWRRGHRSYLVDFPNGGYVTLRGNLFHKGPNASNSVAISYGAETVIWSSNTLDLFHNTVVMTRSGGAFLRAPASAQSVVLTANILAGTGSPGPITGGFSRGSVVQQGTVTSVASNVPGASNTASPNFRPNARLLAQVGLSGAPDTAYVKDAPAPCTFRIITGTLQAAP